MPPQNAVIVPSNVHMDPDFPPPITRPFNPPTTPAGTNAREISFSWGSPVSFSLSISGDIQVGLHALSERSLCDLEFMQFGTPRKREIIHAGRWEGFTTRTFSPGFQGHQFLDTPTNNGVPVHFPFMSVTTHQGQKTTAGHFKNVMTDHPHIRVPEFIIAQDGERHFLWRVIEQRDFMTFLVFIHPTQERQPIAVVEWALEMEFRLRWAGGVPIPLHGLGRVPPGPVITDPAVLKNHVNRVRNTDGLKVINQIQRDGLDDGTKAEQESFFPLRHSAIEPDFWSS
ncbi:hypothetical protein SBA6_980002 [Candidatus Sulfopaludibacter sp. SbA6]|nr:hypothetical protein SBA6_980002 [Candidatus Sulfopaludibacter sp. SbA6]